MTTVHIKPTYGRRTKTGRLVYPERILERRIVQAVLALVILVALAVVL